jgi:hypothetical protein
MTTSDAMHAALDGLFNSIVSVVADDDLENYEMDDVVESKLRDFLREHFPEPYFESATNIAFLLVYFEQWHAKRGLWAESTSVPVG